MSRRFLYFALIGLVLGVFLVGLPLGLKHLAEQQLRAKLDQRGVDLHWKSLAWQWPTTISLHDVEFSTQRSNLEVTGVVDTIEVNLSTGAMLGKTSKLGAISLQTASLKVQKRPADPALENAPTAAAKEDPNTLASTVEPLWENLWESLWENLGKTGALEAKDVEIVLVDDTTSLLTLQIFELALSEDGSGEEVSEDADFRPPQSPYRTLRVRAQAELKASKFSALLNDPDDAAADDLTLPIVPLALDGYLATTAQTIALRIGAASPEGALISLQIPNIADLNLHHLVASIDQARTLELRAHRASMRLGGVENPAVELDILEIRARAKTPQIAVAWRILEPTLAVAPERLVELKRSLARLRQAFFKPDASSSAHLGHKTNAPEDDAPDAWRARLTRWLHGGDLRIVNGHFDLRLIEGDKKTRQIALVEHFQGTLGQGRLLSEGISAGGRVEIGAEFAPGSWLPRTVALDLDNIRLDDLPGVQEGRTLPKRGVRGRVGGIIDAKLLLWTQGDLAPLPSAHTTMNFGGSLAWRDGFIDISGLADAPIDQVNTSADFLVSWAANTARIELDHARLQYGPVVGHLKGQWANFPLDPLLDLALAVDEISCQEAVRALPDALLGAYRQIEIEGSAAPRFFVHLPVNHPRRIRVRLEDFVDLCHVTALRAAKDAWPALTIAEAAAPKPAQPKDPARFDPSSFLAQFSAAPAPERWPAPPHVRDERYELPELPETHRRNRFDDVHWLNRNFVKQVIEGVSEEAEIFVGPGTPDYRPLRELPPFVAAAAYLSEEMQFYNGHGISLGLIERALRLDFEKGRFVYGGSTVTQQLVKNLFLTRDKTLARKFKEALIAWRIEDGVPKWRVLELYINVIEFAPDIYGIGPAARYYFDKEAADLSPKEAVFLAVLKPAPWYGDRFRRRGSTPSKHWWFDRMGEIMGRLVDKGYLTAEQAEAEKPYILHWDKDGTYLPDPPARQPPEARTAPGIDAIESH